VIIVSVAGASTAAPSPLSARDSTRADRLEAKPPARLAAVKMASPAMNIRRRPNRSEARPPSSRNPPSASVYALTTHWRSEALMPRSSRIDGRATFTIEMSRTTMNCPRHASDKTSHPGVGRASPLRPATLSASDAPGLVDPSIRTHTPIVANASASFFGAENMGQWLVRSSTNDHCGPASSANHG
jgi:hypothetical protein